MLDFLENDSDCFWLINGKIYRRLSPDSWLRDLARYLIKMYKINRSDYGPIKFLLNDTNYEDFEIRLSEIGIQGGVLVDVEYITFSTFPRRPCTLADRDLNIEYKKGILFELTLRDKLEFMIERCLAITRKNGISYIKLPKFLLARTDHPIEINTIRQKIENIENLTQSYLSGIKRIMKDLFIL